MRKYEIMYVIRPDLEEEARKAIVEELAAIFPKFDSEVEKLDEWGMRELAYEIDNHAKGYYVVMDVKATQEARAEFDRVIGLKEEVIRHIVIRDER